MKGRAKDPRATELISEAMMCKMYKCNPDELGEIDYEKIILHQTVYSEMMKKNPMGMLL